MILGVVKVTGHSMEPAYQPGQFLVVSSVPYRVSRPQIGDTVIISKDLRTLVKRIVGAEDNRYWVEGDNKSSSVDSRAYGTIPRDQIIAKVIY